MNTDNVKIYFLSVLLIYLLALCVPYAHADENLQYNYDDDRQIREATYEDGTKVDYSYDTSSNRLSKDTATSGHSNSAPTAPTDPDPYDTQQDVPLPVTLSWTASTDSDTGDVVSYDIYLGTSSPPSLIASGQQANSYSVQLEPDTTYYWKIVARDNHNAITAGSEWSFTTDVPSVPLVADFTGNPTSG